MLVADTETPPRDPSVPPKTWYGWQTLAADAFSLGVILVATGDVGVQRVGALGFVLAAPTIHLAHGHAGLGVASLALRVVGTVAPAFLWASQCMTLGFGDADRHGAWCGVALPALLLVGIFGPIVFDATLAWDRPNRRRSARALHVAPWAAPNGSSGVAVMGAF